MTDPLFPRPRRLVHLDLDVRHDHEVVEELDPTLPAEGFVLAVDDAAAMLRVADEAGRRHGRRAVAQLRDDAGRLPRVEVHDHPSFAVRGVMLDVSRDRVPTRATLERLVDVLARCRCNHLQLYVEHTFRHPGEDVVWADASPLEGEDLAWLDDRCAAVGIELAVNQNTFGHFERWLRHDVHRHRAECPDGIEIAPGIPFPPSVLEPTEANAEFAVGLVRNQLAHVRSRLVNIGCDETFELGRGASRARVEADGLGRVYLDHLRRLVAPLVADGCTVGFWGDVIARHPDLIPEVPTDRTIALVWNYEAPDAPKPDLPDGLRDILGSIGIDVTSPTDFAGRLAPFVAAGIRHWVVPGTSSWNSLVGRLDNARSNLLDAARAGVDSGAEGMLVTDWGDNGHLQPLTVALPAIVYGAAVAWDPEANADLDVSDVLDREVFADEAGVLGGVLDEIGRLDRRTGLVAANASPIAAALLPRSLVLASGDLDPVGVAAVVDALDRAAERLTTARPAGPDGPAIVEELAVTIDLARFGAETLAGRAGITDLPPPAERADRLAALAERFRAAWRTSSRPGGLSDAAGRLDVAVADLRGAQP